jgi:hypothetical protein
MLTWFSDTVVNKWFYGGLVAGALLRVYGGEIISATTGLAVGILIIEAVRFFVWYFARG